VSNQDTILHSNIKEMLNNSAPISISNYIGQQ